MFCDWVLLFKHLALWSLFRFHQLRSVPLNVSVCLSTHWGSGELKSFRPHLPSFPVSLFDAVRSQRACEAGETGEPRKVTLTLKQNEIPLKLAN